MSGPIEVKVSAATIASAVSGLGLWALQTYVFRADVPLPVVAAVTTVVPAIVTFIAGYLAPHTPRPDLQVDPVDVAAACGEPPAVEVEDATPSGRHVLGDDPDDLPTSHFETPHRREPPRSYITRDEHDRLNPSRNHPGGVDPKGTRDRTE